MLSMWCSKKEFMPASQLLSAAGIVAAISALQTWLRVDIPYLSNGLAHPPAYGISRAEPLAS
jgi:hypothetical protein